MFMTNVTELSAYAQAASQTGDLLPRVRTFDAAFDPGPVNGIYRRLPLLEAEDLICRFLEDIARHLDRLQACLARGDQGGMSRPARRVELAARQIGLVELADSARHLRTCLDQQDGVALQAVIARAERAFDMAVNEVWNLREG